MKLRISNITLKNFKTFEQISINPNPDFNIIIGENSSGKSTIFEAIHLWEKCYQTYITSSRKTFYKVKTNTNRYVNYQDLDFLRITKDEDLFNNPKNSQLGKCAQITISLTNSESIPQTWNLGFKITCPTSIENAFYRVQPIDEAEFAKFASEFCSTGKLLDEAIFIYQTRPVSGVHQFEPYYNEAQIKKKIQKGYSHEVLRNKIISRRKAITQFEESISQIVEKKIKFTLPAQNKKDKDEFVHLDVSIENSKSYDLHLQGSGFLQIVEILATVEFIDAPLKLLLVDEPDSHIHSKIQQNLLNYLRKIDHNQFFVISHNDQFVTNAGENEIFFLNDEAKNNGILEPIKSSEFDLIKNSLGGVILSLEKLNQAKKIVFVEGNDDELYLRSLCEKIKTIKNSDQSLATITFFPLRGKDNILQKIEYNQRTLSSLFKGKEWNVIFDRDFSTSQVDSSLKKAFENKKVSPFSHDGYCIESVLFSDIGILKKFIFELVRNTEIYQDNLQALNVDSIDKIVEDKLDTIFELANDMHSSLNKEIETSFLGQKNNRPEFNNLQFSEVMRSWSEDGSKKLERIMSKPLITQFILEIETTIQSKLFLRSSDKHDEISSKLLNGYIDFLSDIDDLYPSYRNLLTALDVL